MEISLQSGAQVMIVTSVLASELAPLPSRSKGPQNWSTVTALALSLPGLERVEVEGTTIMKKRSNPEHDVTLLESFQK